MTPTIVSLSPSEGHTGGQTLVEIVGTGFRVPEYPPAQGVTETPVTMRVTIGGAEATIFGVVDEETLLVLTPSHDESGIPATAQNEATAASDVTVENLDDDGDPIAGESATLAEAFSFRRPILDQPTTSERVIDALIVELRRQVPRGVDVIYDPHTDYDEDTGDALNIVRFAKLPGIGLTGLRQPISQVANDRTDVVVPIDDERSVVRRPPVIRDALLTIVGASDNRTELLRLELAVEMIFQKLSKVTIPLDVGDASRGVSEYDVKYTRGDPVTYGDRTGTGNVVSFTAEISILNIEETDLLGAPEAGLDGAPAWLAHEGTTGLVWKVAEGATSIATFT